MDKKPLNREVIKYIAMVTMTLNHAARVFLTPGTTLYETLIYLSLIHIFCSDVPLIILVIGINGGGKTTTIGKLAHKLKQEGKTVMLAAADTFRARCV